eukprot:4215411-Pleurochrysis_carterae.AAC.1
MLLAEWPSKRTVMREGKPSATAAGRRWIRAVMREGKPFATSTREGRGTGIAGGRKYKRLIGAAAESWGSRVGWAVSRGGCSGSRATARALRARTARATLLA